MGFLYALLLMCGWMIYGGAHYFQVTCNIPVEKGNEHSHPPWLLYCKIEITFNFSGPFNTFIAIGQCNPWVSWVLSNALLHIGWVTLLTICQTYQIIWLGMTTNERMNRGRYRHFQEAGGKSPFNRGPIRNTADFLECSCFGMVHPVKTNWLTYFDMDKTIEHEPLLRPTDNYQYVWSDQLPLQLSNNAAFV